VVRPAEFAIQRRGECDGAGGGDRTGMTSGLLNFKFNKGIKKTT
jgi:hypothetical protein